MGLSTISRAKRDQTWREDVVTNGIGRVEGIAVDWIAGERLLRHVRKHSVHNQNCGIQVASIIHTVLINFFTLAVSVSIVLAQTVCYHAAVKQERDMQTDTEEKEVKHSRNFIVSPPTSTGNIYWTDQGFDVIEVARLNGSFRYVVISQGLDKPRAITVHPAKG